MTDFSPCHVVQCDLVLKKFGELEDVAVGDRGSLSLHLVVERHEAPDDQIIGTIYVIIFF